MSSPVHDSSHAAQTQELMVVAEWLAQQFLNPMTTGRVQASRSAHGQAALRWIGDFLGRQAAADQICLAVSKDAVDETVASIQRSHTMFFSGISRQYSVLPYASAWDGTGHLFGPAVDRMQALLTELDVHLPDDCAEPSDHLAIQLACMAEALRQERDDCVRAVLDEMQGWVPNFADELVKADSTGFHGNAARFLIALLDEISTHSSRTRRCDAAATAAMA